MASGQTPSHTFGVDPVRDYLARNDETPKVVDLGLDGLVAEWTHIVDKVEAGSEVWLWEEWMNDLDAREILRELLACVPEARRALPEISAADVKFRAVAIETNDCQWGDHVATKNGWTKATQWWYWSKPPAGYLP